MRSLVRCNSSCNISKHLFRLSINTTVLCTVSVTFGRYFLTWASIFIIVAVLYEQITFVHIASVYFGGEVEWCRDTFDFIFLNNRYILMRHAYCCFKRHEWKCVIIIDSEIKVYFSVSFKKHHEDHGKIYNDGMHIFHFAIKYKVSPLEWIVPRREHESSIGSVLKRFCLLHYFQRIYLYFLFSTLAAIIHIPSRPYPVFILGKFFSFASGDLNFSLKYER